VVLGFELWFSCLSSWCSTTWAINPGLFAGMFSYWLRWGLVNFLPKLASNCDPLALCLLSRQV
jgi:hypothetical protein